jgi:hypothetical protein
MRGKGDRGGDDLPRRHMRSHCSPPGGGTSQGRISTRERRGSGAAGGGCPCPLVRG